MDMFTGNKIKETYRDRHMQVHLPCKPNITYIGQVRPRNKDQAVEKEVQKIKV
jgi:hypothetical protein